MGKWVFARSTRVMEEMRMEDRQDESKSWIRPLLLVRFHITQANSSCHAMPCLFEGTGEGG